MPRTSGRPVEAQGGADGNQAESDRRVSQAPEKSLQRRRRQRSRPD
ncbi:MAG: hypothetical protein MZW92_00605 [Comamonadaceae bacterium]|nr:hypothetical protein [Comamonadaceae bacterium]